jgi:hypothetical protein
MFEQSNYIKKIKYKVCGVQVHKPNLQQVRIIGGYQAKPKTWPWTVSIGINIFFFF